jgi:predicted RNA-binding protein with PIN domain
MGNSYPRFLDRGAILNVPYLIDGHNLIPKIPGISLGDLDDEIRLVQLLQEFCRVKQKRVEVFFDNAPPGGSSTRTFGSVVARFVRQGKTADRAIQEKLSRLGGEARNWTVVSSDREVQANARAARAKVLRSEAFAQQLASIGTNSPQDMSEEGLTASSQSVEEWMEIFGIDPLDEDE